MRYVLSKATYNNKDEIKRLGARWDPSIGKWWCDDSHVYALRAFGPTPFSAAPAEKAVKETVAPSLVYHNPFLRAPKFPKEDLTGVALDNNGMANFLVFDTETTGTSNNDEVIELGILDAAGNEVYHSLFKPEVTPDPHAMEVNGITEEELKNAPKFKDEWPKIKAVMQGHPLIAYNIAFDKRLLTTTAVRYGIPKRECDALFEGNIDAMKVVQKYAKKMKLQEACDMLGVNIEQTHRASDDCLMILYVFDKLGQLSEKNRVNALNGIPFDVTEDMDLTEYNNEYYVKSEKTGNSFEEDMEDIFDGIKLHSEVAEFDKARKIVNSAIREGKAIVNVSDYDVDGITSAYELSAGIKTIHKFMSLKNDSIPPLDYTTRLPRRFSEGYGFSTKHASEILANHPEPGLIITTDNGVQTFDAIDMMKAAGWTVLVLDHHLPLYEDQQHPDVTRPVLPNADLVIDANAKLECCDFHGYCAGGLVYKFFESYKSKLSPKHFDELINGANGMPSVAALATAADSVPLIEIKDGEVNTGENWQILKDGLEDLRNGKAPVGLRMLAQFDAKAYEKGQDPFIKDLNTLTEEDFGFSIAPLINAGSRMHDDGAKIGLELLQTNDRELAKEKVIELHKCNKERQDIVEEAATRSIKYIKDSGLENMYPMVISSDECGCDIPHGVLGLVASKLVNEFHTTAVVMSKPDVNGVMAGSARGCEGSNVAEILGKCDEFLLTHGGHSGAAGLSCHKDQYKSFQSASQIRAGSKPEIPANPFDYLGDISEVDKVAATIAKYAPYGQSHPKPVYLFRDVQILKDTPMGKKGNMVRFNLPNNIAAVDFSGNILKTFIELGRPQNADMLGTIGTNTYCGRTTSQIRLTCFTEPQPTRTEREALMHASNQGHEI